MREVRNPSLSAITTLGLGGTCSLELTVSSRDDLAAMDDRIRELGLPVYVVGRGSNIFGLDGSHEAVLVRPAFTDGPAVLGDETADGGVLVSCGAGISLPVLLAFLREKGLSGMEGLAGIPGTVGGAVYMNAGAYGGELKDVLESVRVMTPDGEVKELKTEELDLGYRHSCIPERGYIVLSARIRLEKGDPEAIRVRMDELAAKRREKQPLEYPSAGSTFKRPEGYFAGKLIEDAGLRGYQEGGAQVSEKHCGFVINRDHATASDIAGLCGTVQKRVYEQFGVKLETEVKMLGF